MALVAFSLRLTAVTDLSGRLVPKKCEFTTIHIDAVTTPFDGT